MLSEKVYNTPEDIGTDVRQTADTRNHIRTTSTTNTEDVEHAVYARPHRLRVVHIESRRRVDKDDVVHLTQIRNNFIEALARDNFGRRLQLGSRRHHRKILDDSRLNRIFYRRGVRQHVGKTARVRQTEPLVKIGLSHVAVDQEDFLTRLGELHGEVGYEHGLTIRRVRARSHENHALNAFELVEDARSNKSEVFAKRIVGVVIRNQGVIRLLRFVIHLTGFRRNVFEARNKWTNLHQDWRAAHAHNVGRRVERSVRHVDEVS